MKSNRIILIALALLFSGLAIYLFRPISGLPESADFHCLDLQDGVFVLLDSLPPTNTIYGMGLIYRPHLEETAAEFNPDAIPPIFKKDIQSLARDNDQVRLPSKRQLTGSLDEFDPESARHLETEYDNVSPLLDYEVELGFMLLEDVQSGEIEAAGFVPPIGFFIANDLSARTVALMGEGSHRRYEYWGISKSFPGFTPTSDQVWIPDVPTPNSIPCVTIETYVNGQSRQSQATDQMLYTPAEMLRFIHQKYPEATFKAGDMVLTGTPGGVAIATPRVLVRLSNLLGFDRYKKLSVKLGGDLSAFLQAGDTVEVGAEGLGKVTVQIVE